MAAWAEMGAGGRAASVVLAVAGVALIVWGWQGRAPVPETPGDGAAADAPAATVIALTPEAAPAPDAVPVSPVEAAPVQMPAIAPSFDSWRVDADGSAVVAGRAELGSVVSILIDGAPVAEAAVNASGAFVALFTLPANPNPSLLTLEAVLPDGSVLVSPQSVALAPIEGPVSIGTAEAPASESDQAESAQTDPAGVNPPADAGSDQVAEATPPPAVMITEDGAAVVQAVPAEPSAVIIDAIAYTASGDVQLSGKGQAGAFVRLYLDDALIATTPITPAGQWTVTLTGTPPGVYTLRADQIDASGTVTARFETPFKRETREALAALATPAAPEAEAAGQPALGPVVGSAAEAVVDPAPQPAVPETAPEATGTPAPASVAQPADTTPAPEATAAADPAVSPDAEGAAPVSEPPAPSEAPASEAPASVPVPVDATAPDPAAPPSASPPNAPLVVAAPTPGTSVATLAEPAAHGTAPASLPSVSITVQPGFTLWGIARQQLGDGILYVQVFDANKDRIRDPDLIYPGQVFVLPTR